MNHPTLTIVIVNWNAGNLLRECIASIASTSKEGFILSKVIIVDNASSDNSLSDIEKLGVSVTLIQNSENNGFATACNQGAAESTSDYFLFLNPDTRLFEDSLSFPITFMQSSKNTDVGIVGIQLLDENDNVARSCSRTPSLIIFLVQALGFNRLPKFRHLTHSMQEWPHDTTRDVDQVIGAFFLIRQSLFESLGGFDQRFFVYFEEVDLSYRVSKLGYRSIYLSNAQAFHAGCGTSDQVKAHRLFFSLRSRILYGFKHFTPFQAWALFFITLFLEPFTRVTFSLLKGGWREAQHTLRGYMMLIGDLRNILSH